MVFTDVNNTYVRVKESDKKIFYIKKADAKKTFVKGDFISIIGENGSELYKAAWDVIDVYDDETSAYIVQNSSSKTSAEETLIAVHNAFFFRDGVGIDIEQLSNVDGEPGDGYILVYDSANKNWVVTEVEFNTADGSDLDSNVSGLQRTRLQLVNNQLKFNDVSGVQHTVSLPTTTSTGGVTAVEVPIVNKHNATMPIGTPVHLTGTQGSSKLEGVPADASNANMPAAGVLTETINVNGTGNMVIIGSVSDLNTTAAAGGGIIDTGSLVDPSEGDDIYVDSGGGLTTIRPLNPSHKVQKIGAVESVSSTQGKIMVLGAGRTNDVPNLANRNVFIGTASSGTEQRQLIADDILDSTSTNKFFTNALARAAIQAASGSNIIFNQSTGDIDIDDSGYLTQVTADDILAAISGGNGIGVNSEGVISIQLADGSDLSFNANGELDVTASVGAASDLSDYDTLALAADQEFTSTIIFNIPDKSGVKRSFGRYLHNDEIPINTGDEGVPGSMTVKDVLESAFSEPAAPNPSTPTVSGTPQFNQSTGIVITVSIDFGITNAGSTGSGTLYYRQTESDDWTSLQTYSPSYNSDTFSYVHNVGDVAYSTSNKFQYYISVTDQGFTRDSGTRTTGYLSFEEPSFHDASITRTSSLSGATGTSATLREVGDVQSTLTVRVRRNATYVAMDKLFLQVKIGSTWETIPSTEITISSVTNDNYSNYSTLTMSGTSVTTTAGSRDLSGDTSIEFRAVATSDSPGTTAYSAFSIIYSRYAFIVCFDDLEGESQNEMHTIISNFGADNDGNRRRAITDTSGASGYSFPSPLNYDGNSRTPGFDNTNTSDYMYFIYPGDSTAISQILAGGTANVTNAFNDPENTNVTSFTYTNPYGKSRTYQVHRSNVVGSFTGDYLQIT